METYAETLRIASLVTYGALGGATFIRWRRRKAAPDAWASATFLSLATVALVGQIAGAQAGTALDPFVLKLLLAGLVLFPYLLLRFLASFGPLPRWLEWSAAALTAVVVGWSLALTQVPRPGTARPPGFQAYLSVLLAQWVFLFAVVGVRLWRAGRRQPVVARRRMRLLAAAAMGMSIAIVVSASRNNAEVTGVSLAIQGLSLGAAILFFLGLAPPRALRTAWRRREGVALRAAVSDLMRATTAEQVAERLVPHAASLVGARAAAMYDASGAPLGLHGDVPEASADGPGSHRTSLGSGSLVVWTSPYTPFFGRDELQELDALASLAQLALERCELIEREREFISNAAHELRTPMTTVYGMAITLDEHREMDRDTRRQTVDALLRQSTRAKALIDDLLDLARIGGSPRPAERFPVEAGAAIRQALEAAPPPEGTTVRVDAEPGVTALADPEAIERILVNLLTNMYAHGGSNVGLEVRRDDRWVVIVAADDGPGVPPALAPALFEPFSRMPGAATTGSGLGLTICRSLARALGGDVTYEPDGASRARFVVRLERA